MSIHRRNQDFPWVGALFSIFSRYTHSIQAKTAKLTTPTLQLSPDQRKFPQKLNMALPGGAFTPYPYKLRPKKIFRPGDERAPSEPPFYAYVSIIPPPPKKKISKPN